MFSFFENIINLILPDTASIETSESSQHIDVATHRNSKLSFCDRVSVVLIPQSIEYRRAGCDLWWNPDDYVRFREEFMAEMNQCLAADPSVLTIQDALKKICSTEFQSDEIKVVGKSYSENAECKQNGSDDFLEQTLGEATVLVQSIFRRPSSNPSDTSLTAFAAFYFVQMLPGIRCQLWEDSRRRPRPRPKTRGNVEAKWNLLLQARQHQMNELKAQTFQQMFRIFRATLMNSSMTSS